ncbi:GxxExxY protein [bacterium]|nr:GxxExxY protein [bacterium]
MTSEIVKKKANFLSQQIISASIEVHRVLGPGLLESAYEECLCHELNHRSIRVRRQVPVPLIYKNIKLDCGYRIDILVEQIVLIELKSVERLDPIHHAQVLTYLRLSKLWLGLLINFNVPVLRLGIKRFVL